MTLAYLPLSTVLMLRPILALWLCAGATLPLLAADLVQDGKAIGVIVLPSEPTAAEKLAAKELIEHVQKISGALLPTENVEPAELAPFLKKTKKAGQTPVVLGRAA